MKDSLCGIDAVAKQAELDRAQDVLRRVKRGGFLVIDRSSKRAWFCQTDRLARELMVSYEQAVLMETKLIYDAYRSSPVVDVYVGR